MEDDGWLGNYHLQRWGDRVSRVAKDMGKKMTASHMTHKRGTKRRKTSVPDWSIQASAESRREGRIT